jgi:RNA polymerase sigma-B factor
MAMHRTANAFRPDDGFDETAAFAEFARTGCPKLRATLIERHLGLAYKIANKYRGRGIGNDDLEQIAVEALIGAVDRFDPVNGAAFSTFATPTVLGVVRRSFRDQGWAVKVERRTKELAVRLRTARDELGHRLGRSPSVAELAAELDTSEDEVLLAMTANNGYQTRCIDLTGPHGAAVEQTVMAPNDDIADALAIADLRNAIALLPERDRRIVELRLQDWSQSEIGEELGVSQMQISRLLRRSQAAVRDAMA